jgi:putative mRNA 3-end processing factor
MQILHEAKVGVPFIAPEKIYRVSKVCEKHGMRFGRDFFMSSSEEAESMYQHHDSFLAFYHMVSRRHVAVDNAFRIYISGWEFSSPCHMMNSNECRIAFSGHSDFYGLLRYVEESKPKIVITDNHRSGDAIALAREIRRRLKIPARPLPS